MDSWQKNKPLKDLTTVGLGGPAKYFLSVKKEDELIQAIAFSLKEKIPYFFLGGGSNLLISDEGFAGLVIKNEIKGIKQRENTLEVQSGTILQDLVNFSIQKGLFGIHKLIGIPGTVGGAIFGNAGAYGQTISDHLVEAKCFDPNTKEAISISSQDCDFNYRDSSFKRNGLIILEAAFKLDKTDPLKLQKEAMEIIKQRLVKYPANLKCPGSFFKNVLAKDVSPQVLKLIPQEKITSGKISAGYLLEAAGAKGQSLGKIGIAPYHGNLFINKGGGSAWDFYCLAKIYAQKVKAKFGIALEPEVHLVNLPPLHIK